jgi:hypothetical protein
LWLAHWRIVKRSCHLLQKTTVTKLFAPAHLCAHTIAMIHQTTPYSASLIGTIVGCLCLVLSSVATAAKPPPAYAGAWVLNQDETELLRDDLDEKTIKIPTAGRMQVSVMGIPLPGGGGRAASGHSPLTAKQPVVLRCKQMSISVVDKTIQLTYPDLDPLEQKETLRAGHYRGRDSKWNRKKIQQKYKTSERKVSKTWTMRKDGRLLVEVSIKHKKAKKQTFSRVFDRLPTD